LHALLKVARDGQWRAWILMGLNAAMYFEELCELKWSEINFTRGTYATIREKTKADRIPRAAVLWPETIAALSALPKFPVYVFTSKRGTRFNVNSRCNEFRKLADRANVDKTVSFAGMKDGAYTVACQGQPDDRIARVLAGHRAPGLQDSYVLRNPEMVKPACDAVYKAYMK
jgi:integrase